MSDLSSAKGRKFMAREEKTEDRDYGGVAVAGPGYRAFKKKREFAHLSCS